jgi:hypothetical protein
MRTSVRVPVHRMRPCGSLETSPDRNEKRSELRDVVVSIATRRRHDAGGHCQSSSTLFAHSISVRRMHGLVRLDGALTIGRTTMRQRSLATFRLVAVQLAAQGG